MKASKIGVGVSNLPAVGSTYILHRNGIQIAALLSYVSVGILLQVLPPALSILQEEFNTDHATASLVITLFLAPMAAIALPGGKLADRHGVRGILMIGFPLLAVGGLISAFAPGFSILLAGRAISGTGAGLLLVSMLKLLTETFPQKQHGRAFGVFISGLPIGTGIAFDALTPLESLLHVQGEILVGVAVTIGVWLYVMKVIPPRSMKIAQEPRKEIHKASVREVLHSGSMMSLVVSVILGYSAIIGFTTWAPSTLVGYAHIPLVLSALIASILLVIDIPLGPFWGIVSDKVGKRKIFIILAFVIYLTGSLVFPFTPKANPLFMVPLLIGTVALMGVGCAMFFPVALTIPAQSSNENQGTAYGLFFTAQTTGMLIGPIIIGFVLDISSPLWGFMTVSLITFAGLITTFAIRSK